MFTRNILKYTRSILSTTRLISRSTINNHNVGANSHRVNDFEKRLLVWTGKYKTTAEIPQYVASEVVDKARNRMRIRVANIMMAATLVACFFVAMSGKNARDRGESVQKQNLEWHQNYNQQSTK